MNLLTRCPACATLYRVVPDQLRISEGWVKCGQCNDIFDASKHLIEADCEPETQQDQTTDLSSEHESSVVVVSDSAHLMVLPEADAAVQLDQPALHEIGQSSPEQAEGSVGSEGYPGAKPALEENFSETQVTDMLGKEQIEIIAEVQTQQSLPAPESVMACKDDGQGPDALLSPQSDDTRHENADVSFLTTTARQTFWEKPVVRGFLLLLSLFLSLGLLTQWVYFERDRLVAQRPDLKPVLQVYCQFLQCDLQPLKRIESLSVDSVGFNELGKGTYRLSFSVKNSNMLPLAFPATELTLTDAQEQAVYRRVFNGHELGAADAEIAAGAEWPVVVTFNVSSEVATQRVLGYRLMVFYP